MLRLTTEEIGSRIQRGYPESRKGYCPSMTSEKIGLQPDLDAEDGDRDVELEGDVEDLV